VQGFEKKETAMKCNEIQERMVELLYDENGTPSASPDLMDHIRSCPACGEALEELKTVQRSLKLWKDESPACSVAVPGIFKAPKPKSLFSMPILRYAGIAAMLLITLLALANLEISWKNDEFSLSMHLFGAGRPGESYYTKSQMRDLLKQVMDDSESRQTETNYLMIQQLLDTVEHDRLVDLRYIRNQSAADRGKN
jgi:hypothetical protein